jgi:hypothetical protein
MRASIPHNPTLERSDMLDVVFQLVSEVVLFHVGRAVIYAFSLGRVNPTLDSRWQPLVSLLGAFVVLAAIIGVGVWFHMPKG